MDSVHLVLDGSEKCIHYYRSTLTDRRDGQCKMTALPVHTVHVTLTKMKKKRKNITYFTFSVELKF